MQAIAMENEHAKEEKVGLFARALAKLKDLPESIKSGMYECGMMIKTLAKDDPRRITHSFKVGLSLTLVSLFYYYQPLYQSFGVSAMWAIMTVVVVFEFYVGATLGKGLNRALATFIAGALAVGAHHLASLSGHAVEPLWLGIFVFIQSTTTTFVRFFPNIKARYDYALVMFILTFTLISLSGFRDDEILIMAQKRLSTAMLGGSACVIISIFVRPVWAGEELHNLIANNIDKLGDYLEEFGGGQYFTALEHSDNKSSVQGYASVLDSENTEKTLANFARWEPGHGRFMFRHPWKQYLKIGNLARQCAYRMESLSSQFNGYPQACREFRDMIEEECKEISLGSGKTLKELAVIIKTMTNSSSIDKHITNSKAKIKGLQSLLQSNSWNEGSLLAVIPAATVASLLIDVIECTEKIAESVEELASLAHFKCSVQSSIHLKSKPRKSGSPEPADGGSDCVNVVITSRETERGKPRAP